MRGFSCLVNAYVNADHVFAGDILHWGENKYFVLLVNTGAHHRPHIKFEVKLVNIDNNTLRTVYFGRDDSLKYCRKIISNANHVRT
jgi:hypothetical protein